MEIKFIYVKPGIKFANHYELKVSFDGFYSTIGIRSQVTVCS